jgi:subtilisin family serine protease
MATFNVFYAGQSKAALKLQDSDDYLVVRYETPGSLERLPMTAAMRKIVQPLQTIAQDFEAGVEIFRCNESHKTVKKLRDAIRLRLKKLDGIRFVGKVLKQGNDGEPFVYTENIFVQFLPATSLSVCRKIITGFGLKIKSEPGYATRSFFVEAKEGTGKKIFALANKLLKCAEVKYCHPELVRPIGKKVAFEKQWHLFKTRINGQLINQHANVEAAWAISQGENAVIAVIDDGVDTRHEEFAGSGKVLAARDFTRNISGASPRSGDNHGTACAGVACANGLRGASGVAPKARLMPLRLRSVLGSQAEAEAFKWAADNGADVISCSWGPSDGRWWDSTDPAHNTVVPLPDSTRLAINYATTNGRNGKGCVITWAAGNGNESVDNDGYASYENVIAVAACSDLGRRSAYSDKGQSLWCAFPSSNGEPSLTDGIWTTDRRGRSGYNVGDVTDGDAAGNYTDDFGGTSSACPGVAGVAALILSRNPQLSWLEVKDVIRQSCDKIDSTNGGYDAQGHSPLYGYGRINALKAVKLALPEQPKYTVLHHAMQDRAIKDNKTTSIALEVGDNKTLKDVIVGIDIEHTYIGDLLIDLIAPASSGIPIVRLHNGEGNGTNNLKREYNLQTTADLAALIGQNPKGKWTLRVKDTASQDTGKIKGFSLRLSF